MDNGFMYDKFLGVIRQKDPYPFVKDHILAGCVFCIPEDKQFLVGHRLINEGTIKNFGRMVIV